MATSAQQSVRPRASTESLGLVLASSGMQIVMMSAVWIYCGAWVQASQLPNANYWTTSTTFVCDCQRP